MISPMQLINPFITSYNCLFFHENTEALLSASFNDIIQVYQLQPPCFALDPQPVFILQLKACPILPISPYLPHPETLTTTSLLCFYELHYFLEISHISDTMQYLSLS